MYRKRTNQLKRMKTTENIKLHIIHCKLVYSFALVWLLFSFYTFTLQIWKILHIRIMGNIQQGVSQLLWRRYWHIIIIQSLLSIIL